MSDWQVGDLAVCVITGPVVNAGRCRHGGNAVPPKDSVRRVSAVALSMVSYPDGPKFPCGCVALLFDDGTSGITSRFRKVVSDKHEECEPEFVTLLKRIKIGVAA